MAAAEPSSFRDQSSRVYLNGGRVLRGFRDDAAARFLDAVDSGAIQSFVEAGSVVTFEVSASDDDELADASLVVESERLPFVSVPAEWSFSMLKDAALLTLDLNIALLDHGFILKDASAFNVTFRGSQPVFLDLGSIERFGETGIWNAYGQFVDHFLTPLLLEAHAGVPFQPRLRGTVDGIPVREANAMLRGRNRRKPGVFSHIAMRSRLERSSSTYGASERTAVSATSLPRDAVQASIHKMRKLIAGLTSSVSGVWSEYESTPPYDPDEIEAKRDFVVRSASDVGGGLLLDVGANTGFFSRAAAQHFSCCLAVDIDPGAVDRLYQRLARGSAGDGSIIPLVVDLINPTPAVGWRNTERASFLDRTDADLSLWLAVLHHLTITGGIPLSHSLELAARLSRFAVIEFVLPDDDMVQLIGATMSPDAAPYDEPTFMTELNARFEVLETGRPKPTRKLFFVRSKLRAP